MPVTPVTGDGLCASAVTMIQNATKWNVII